MAYPSGLVGQPGEFDNHTQGTPLLLPSHRPQLLVIARRQIIEQEYTSTFSALEELLLEFGRRRSMEFLMDGDRWKKLEKELKKAVKASVPPISDEKRGLLYEAFAGAARVPLRERFNAFATEYRLDVSDLWPAFEHKISLVNIRNRVVHGDFETDRHLGSLVVASSHLRWTLERMVLAVLGWPMSASEVAPRFLGATASAMLNRDAAISDLAQNLKD